MVIEKDCNNWKFSSNINEISRTALNFLLFFYEKILHVQKSTEKLKKARKNTKTQPNKSTKANKRTKIKSELKKHLSGK